MPVSPSDLSKVLSILADEDQLKVTIKGSATGGLIAGLTATAGGLLMGPPGLLLGGAVGGALGYYNQQGKFKPVSAVINEMDSYKQRELYDSMVDIISGLAVEDYVGLLALVNGQPGLLIRQQLLHRLFTYIQSEMNLEISE